MVCMTLVDPNDFMAVIYRVGLKSMEFYIIWSTYSAFKLFKGFKKVKNIFFNHQRFLSFTVQLFQKNPANLAYFLNDCIISAATDFSIASVFAYRFFQHGKGFIVMAVYTLLFSLNVMFFINVKLVQNQLQCNETAENRLNDIMKPDEAIDIFEMIPRIRSSTQLNETRNYCYELVFQEINSVYDNSTSNDVTTQRNRVAKEEPVSIRMS